MILIPELETVVILVPRTGTGSLRRVIAATYPKAMLLYRHMEADGVPQGYDRWAKVGVVRSPLERLWSLFKFLRTTFCDRAKTSGSFAGAYEPEYVERVRASVSMPFEQWLLTNELPFTGPYDSAFRGRFWAGYTLRHHLPENRKSQFVYLRPDLGTEVYRYDDLSAFQKRLGIEIGLRHNQTHDEVMPPLGEAATAYMARCFEWDYQAVSPSLNTSGSGRG